MSSDPSVPSSSSPPVRSANPGVPTVSAKDDSAPVFSAFISYASANKEKAHEICDTLESRGLECWMAPRNIRFGHDYGEEIIDGIRRSRCLVLVLSDAANASPMVPREVERAVSLKKPVFPIRIEDVMPARSLEFFVSATHWLDAWSGSLSDHANRLADEISDERRFNEVRSELKRRVRRRHLPKWIGAFLLIVAAAALGTWLTNRGNGNGGTTIAAVDTSASAVQAFTDEFGFPPSQLTADKFKITPRAIENSIYQGQLFIEVADSIAGIMGPGTVEFRVGNRPWKPVVKDPATGSFFAVLDQRDVEARGPVELRINARIVASKRAMPGPFVYQVELGQKIGEDLVAKAASNSSWLKNTMGNWYLDPTELARIAEPIRAIKIGSQADRFEINEALPARVGLDQPINVRMTMNLATILGFAGKIDLRPLARYSTLYVQIEFHDGSVGPVRPVRVSDFPNANPQPPKMVLPSQ